MLLNSVGDAPGIWFPSQSIQITSANTDSFASLRSPDGLNSADGWLHNSYLNISALASAIPLEAANVGIAIEGPLE